MDHTVVWRLWSMLWWGYMSLRHEKVWVWSLCDNLRSAFHNLLIAVNSAKQKEIMCKGIPKTARKWVWCLELRCPAGFCCGGDPLRLEGGCEEQFWWKNRPSFFVSTLETLTQLVYRAKVASLVGKIAFCYLEEQESFTGMTLACGEVCISRMTWKMANKMHRPYILLAHSLSKYICKSELLTIRVSVRFYKCSFTKIELLQTSLASKGKKVEGIHAFCAKYSLQLKLLASLPVSTKHFPKVYSRLCWVCYHRSLEFMYM